MALFLEIVSMVCVAVLITSYLAYRRCLRPENRERKTEQELRKEVRLYTVAMIGAVAVIIISALILRTMV